MRPILGAALVLALAPASGQASQRVLVLDGGRAHARVDRYLDASDPFPAARAPHAPATPRAAAGHRRRTVVGELKRLRDRGAISPEDYASYRETWSDALALERKLSGRRRLELTAVTTTVHAIAANGLMTSSRLPQLFLTVRRNRQWWASGPLPASGQRVSFKGSRLIWQYYPGQGLALQILANFGKANAYWMAEKDSGLRGMLDELVPLAAQRAGGIAWEYDFRFDGGRPPWTSALSQGTAVQALARASQRLADPAYAALIPQALKVFQTAPPSGVRVAAAKGPHFLIYSFAPGLRVLNAFVQSLNGLYDAATITGDSTAMGLFQEGVAQAQSETPRYDTGAWSLYSVHGAESTLSYHRLLRDFLRGLCERTTIDVFCGTAERFTADLKQPPRLRVVSRSLRQHRRGALRFKLSKRSTVGLTVRRHGTVVYATSASFPYGERAFAFAPRHSGRYELSLRATDQAGNVGATTATVTVRKARRR